MSCYCFFFSFRITQTHAQTIICKKLPSRHRNLQKDIFIHFFLKFVRGKGEDASRSQARTWGIPLWKVVGGGVPVCKN